MLINFWEIRSLSGLHKIRSLCCQLVTQQEQKPLSEKVGSFHQVSVCVCPGPVRSKLWGSGEGSKGGWEGHELRIQILVLSEGQRTGSRQLGKNILDRSSEESSVSQGWWGAKSCYSRSPACPRNRPAFESLPHSLTGECGLHENGAMQGNGCQNGAPGLSVYSVPCSPALIAYSHGLHSPPLLYSTDARKSFVWFPLGLSSSVRF